MLTAIFNIISVIIAVIIAKILDLYNWYKNTIKTIPQKPWNILKIVVVTLLIWYAISRIPAIRDLDKYDMMPPEYTETEVEYLNQDKIERYVRLQGKTHYFNKYIHGAVWCYYRNKHFLGRIYLTMTYSTDQYRFHRHVFELFLARTYNESPERYQEELELITWMEPFEKDMLTKKIKKFNK